MRHEQRTILLVVVLLLVTVCAHAQGNYEIQVYASETVAPKTTMVELHSNFTPIGQRYVIDRVYPTNRQEHETVEITQGITNWSEVGFYIFTSEQSGHGVQWVGDHIRPRVRAPESWHWPVGVSISTEIGYQRAFTRPTPGPGRYGPSSINKWDAGIWPSTLRSNAPGTDLMPIKVCSSHPA